jgi:hypothetical protein
MFWVFYLSLTQLAKMLCLPYYAYVFSSTKLEIRAGQNRFCLEGRVVRGRWWRRRAGGRNDPNNEDICE